MDIALRATVIFVALYLLVRLMGKRELGQMTPFELIVLVVIGDLIQQGVTQNDFSLTGAIIAISTIAFLALLMSWASYLWPWAERVLPLGVKAVKALDRYLRLRGRHPAGDPQADRLRRPRLVESGPGVFRRAGRGEWPAVGGVAHLHVQPAGVCPL